MGMGGSGGGLFEKAGGDVAEFAIHMHHLAAFTGEEWHGKTGAQSAAAVDVERMRVRHLRESRREPGVGDVLRSAHMRFRILSRAAHIEHAPG